MNIENKKFYIKTWGCQMNEYDSLTISSTIKKHTSYIETKNFIEAEILILNTCSIREKAQEKLFHQLGRWKKLKKKNKNIIIAVGGCVANQEGSKILKRAKFVDIIFGTQTLHRLPEMIVEKIKNKKFIIDISFPKLEKFKKIVPPKFNSYSASISIMEGCNKYCSFCIVPYTRGKEISRPFYDIINNILYLAKHGIKEIQLLGQNVNSYKSTGNNNTKHTFSELLKKISSIPMIERIRFITSNPMDFTDDIIKIYAETPKLVSFLHLPIQSGSNRILKLMKRPYSVEEYKTIINKLKTVRPNIQISSDFIVGFPGETENDFSETMKIISEINFDMSFSFIYSPRPGTPAAKLKDNVNISEKKNRLQTLQKKIKEQISYWNKKIIHSQQKILVEKSLPNTKNQFLGTTENNRKVIFNSQNDVLGKIITVKIIKKKNNFFEGIQQIM
ncbi:tRNA (N6-isopentenyl adenosine(37)-C2)-methylthiotransferase MiaB [Buchnera aphidicola]|uniref:tRNA-2-methylthio-N(6)-dimethylallyladenosine synthase n=1 Tax=Buchnera aphidicola (Sarucallis kahawaluokalani) TaxID=1241878 RepID=A0A4D6YM44_9GAMM|nr:tRNA (N6-isopentenyl adenosine(37)-C2)-methylthiotransferase MiaB [Buchnera aphidicola]QCI26075.1 tRNA (N6-isopentenyl adenosine(37)-C2)-methylthiotransferase MiaB [Buchnera aphidicola (Sarucallis kahawaluokalani)]